MTAVFIILGIVFCIWFFVNVVVPIAKGFIEAAANVVGAVISIGVLIAIGAVIANL